MTAPAYVVTIDGVTKAIQDRSIRIFEAQGNRNLASFDVYSKTGSYRPTLDDEVLITEAGVRIFGGNVSACRETGCAESLGGLQILNRIDATDFNALADRRYFNGTIPEGTTVEDALDVYVLPYLSGYGVTLSGSQATGAALPELRYEYAQVSQVLTDIAAFAGNWTWEIDYDKELRVFDPGAESAPFNIAVSDGNTIGDITVEPSRENYANRIIVRYNAAAVEAYAFLNGSGGGSSIVDGNNVVIGSRTYTWQATLTNVNGNVLLGGSVSDSLANLVAAITGGAGAGSLYAAATTINSQVEAVGPSAIAILVRAITPGAAGNSIGVSTTASLVWHTEGSIPTSTLTLGADESLTNIAIVEDTGEQASHGVWEAVIEAPTDSQATAEARGAAYLAQRLPQRQLVTYTTRRLGIRPSQTQSITLAKRNLNDSFLVQSVETREGKLGQLERTVKAIAGTTVQSAWQDTYRVWSGGTGAIAVAGGAGGTVIVSGAAYVFFGGSLTDKVSDPGPAYVPACAVQVLIDTAARGTVIGTLYVRVKVASGTVTVRLRNVDLNTTAGTSTAQTSGAWRTTSFSVTFTAGAYLHEVQLLSSAANVNMQLGGAYLI